jgi:hypothetical protein
VEGTGVVPVLAVIGTEIDDVVVGVAEILGAEGVKVVGLAGVADGDKICGVVGVGVMGVIAGLVILLGSSKPIASGIGLGLVFGLPVTNTLASDGTCGSGVVIGVAVGVGVGVLVGVVGVVVGSGAVIGSVVGVVVGAGY